MISALALFNALLLGYSRIPFVLADDGLLPKTLATLDVHGTPRTAVIVSAVFYSLFALVAFGKLVVADVLLYSLALFLSSEPWFDFARPNRHCGAHSEFRWGAQGWQFSPHCQ